jgi:hypothetical protein
MSFLVDYVVCYCRLRLTAYNPTAANDAIAMSSGGTSGTMKPGLHGGTRELKNRVQTPDRPTARMSILGFFEGKVTVNDLGVCPTGLPASNGPKLYHNVSSCVPFTPRHCLRSVTLYLPESYGVTIEPGMYPVLMGSQF